MRMADCLWNEHPIAARSTKLHFYQRFESKEEGKKGEEEEEKKDPKEERDTARDEDPLRNYVHVGVPERFSRNYRISSSGVKKRRKKEKRRRRRTRSASCESKWLTARSKWPEWLESSSRRYRSLSHFAQSNLRPLSEERALPRRGRRGKQTGCQLPLVKSNISFSEPNAPARRYLLPFLPFPSFVSPSSRVRLHRFSTSFHTQLHSVTFQYSNKTKLLRNFLLVLWNLLPSYPILLKYLIHVAR